MNRLYEVRIHEPAVTEGLFPRPERYRFTNMWQWNPDIGRIKPLRYCEGTWRFLDGKCLIYDMASDGYIPAEIVGEIDKSRAMDSDRFESIANSATPQP